MRAKTSALPNFRQLSIPERRRQLAEIAEVDETELARALNQGGLDAALADKMIENAIGTLALPFGIALNIQVNGVDYLVPMAIEEPSVVAAASHAAKRVRAAGGFSATMDEALMTAQIQLHRVGDPAAAVARIHAASGELRVRADR